MSSTRYNWFTVDDHDDLIGDGVVSVGTVPANSGRGVKSADITLTTPDDASAVISVNQEGADEMLSIDHFEDSNGNTLSTLPVGGGIVYMVGYSNCGYLDATDTTTKTYTDINEVSGMLHQGGYLIYEDEGSGTMHSGIQIAASIIPDYGLVSAYMFKMPFYIEENETSDREVNVQVSNQGGTVTDEATITQSGE